MIFLKRLCLAAVCACGLHAQATSTAEDVAAAQAAIRQLKQQTADLEAKLAQMNAKLEAAALQAEAAQTAAPNAADSSSGPTGGAHWVEFHGVSDINFGRPLFEKLPPSGGLQGSSNSFGIGDLDLYTSAHLSDRLTFFGELLITSDFTNEFEAEIDRLMLTYKVNQYLKLTAGKFNTALGYYSNAFHRARYFQTATGRPVMFADEDNGGILPVHSVGLSATGRIPSGTLGLSWVAEVSNGISYTPDTTPVQSFADQNSGKAVNFGVSARPDWLTGLEFGTAVYRDRIYAGDLPKIDETINSFYAVYVTSRTEILNEAALVNNNLFGGRESRSLTGYTQVSRKLGSWRPYFRYDYQNSPASDPLFGAIGRRNGPSLGLRYQLDEFAAFKLQVGRLYERSETPANEVQLQVAFAF